MHSTKGPRRQDRAFGPAVNSGREFPRNAASAAAFSFDPVFDTDRFLVSSRETSVRKVRKSECVFAQGDSADSVFYVHSGSLKYMVVSNRGKEATLGVIGTGDYCGEECLIDEPLRSVTAVAMAPSVLLRVPKKCFVKLLREHNEFSAAFTKFLVGRTQKIEGDLIDQRFHSSEYRLARILLSLAGGGADREGRRSIPRMSQETLASMVGTTRSRISFFLNKFKRAGFIEYSGGIRIGPGLAEMLRGR